MGISRKVLPWQGLRSQGKLLGPGTIRAAAAGGFIYKSHLILTALL